MKTYRMHYRMRVYYCKNCNVYLEIPGECQKYKCVTCGKDISKLKKISDQEFRVHKEISDYKP